MNNFGKTLQWFLKTNGRQYIRTTVGVMLSAFIIIGLTTGMFTGYRNGVNPYDIERSVGLIIALLMIFSLVPSSKIISDIATKQQRTLYMMLPASQNHKYWARILIAAVHAFIVMPLATVAVDLLQMLISFIYKGKALSVTAAAVNTFHGFDNVADPMTICLTIAAAAAITAWMFSFYILGGLAFRKAPLIMTTIVWTAIWVSIGLTTAYTVSSIADEYSYIEVSFIIDKDKVLPLMTFGIATAFTALNLWLAHRIHNNMSIITKKWINF